MKIKKRIFFYVLLLILLGSRVYVKIQEVKIVKKRIKLESTIIEPTKDDIRDLNDTHIPIVLETDNNPFKHELNAVTDDLEDNINVIGKIKINTIDYDSIIIDGMTEEDLKLGICKISDNNINQIGNLVLAGHNMKDGSLFGKLKLLSIGDTFSLTDNDGNSKNYKIYREKVISPYDLSILSQDTDKIKVTLMTCTNNGKERLVLYAEEY